jgi:2-polyprenyl-6-hydroxyphenyl methylase/3-demethylubiquinone-9 3-methyltransferase
MLEVAHRLGRNEAVMDRLRFEHVDTIANLHTSDETFDGILCSSVLEYVPDPPKCLAEFHRVLKPEGILLVSVPNSGSVIRISQAAGHRLGNWIGSKWMSFLDHSKNEYRIQEFEKLLLEIGFSMRMVIPFGSPIPQWVQQQRWGGSLLMFVAEKKLLNP